MTSRPIRAAVWTWDAHSASRLALTQRLPSAATMTAEGNDSTKKLAVSTAAKAVVLIHPQTLVDNQSRPASSQHLESAHSFCDWRGVRGRRSCSLEQLLAGRWRCCFLPDRAPRGGECRIHPVAGKPSGKPGVAYRPASLRETVPGQRTAASGTQTVTRERTMPPGSSWLQTRAVPATSRRRWAYGMRRPWERLAKPAGTGAPNMECSHHDRHGLGIMRIPGLGHSKSTSRIRACSPLP